MSIIDLWRLYTVLTHLLSCISCILFFVFSFFSLWLLTLRCAVYFPTILYLITVLYIAYIYHLVNAGLFVGMERKRETRRTTVIINKDKFLIFGIPLNGLLYLLY